MASTSEPTIAPQRRLAAYQARRSQLEEQYMNAELDLVAPLNPTHPTIGMQAAEDPDSEPQQRKEALKRGLAEIDKLIEKAEKDVRAEDAAAGDKS